MAEQNVNKKSKFNMKAILAETGRKFLVSLKRNPQVIPIAALTVAFVVFSFNLTVVSNTTAKIYGPHMGLCAFISMLFSILSYVCLLNAYPKRQKPNLPMIILVLFMYAGVIAADAMYYYRIVAAVNRPENPIKITNATAYIPEAQNLMIIHIVLIVITMVCVVLEPVFAKLLRKINTSIEVEGNGQIEAIDISSED